MNRLIFRVLILLSVTLGIQSTIKAQEATVQEEFSMVEKMPIFPGCESEKGKDEVNNCTNGKMYRHIMKEVVYPKSLKDSGIEGTVYVTFILDSLGNVTDPTVVKEMKDTLFNQEAIRVINTLPRFIPAEKHGKPTKVQYTIPIRFIKK